MSSLLVGEVSIDPSQFDFSDLSSNVSKVKIANGTLIGLVGIFVALRIAVRALMVRRLFADDYLIIVAAIFTVAFAAVCIEATKFGLGTHVYLLPMVDALERIKKCIQLLYVCQVLYACAIAFTKIAIIASYLRFVQDRKFRISMYSTAVVITGLWFTGIFVTIFQCRPMSGAWDFTNPERHCIDFVDYLYASSAISVTTDVILCVLPCPYLWKLNMPRKQRIILCLLFGGGAGACIAGIMRISKLHTLRSMDMTYECVTCLNLSVIECGLGIICVSIPALRPLAVKLFPAALRSNPSSSSKSPLQSLTQKRSRVQSDRLQNITVEENFTIEESIVNTSEPKDTASFSQEDSVNSNSEAFVDDAMEGTPDFLKP